MDSVFIQESTLTAIGDVVRTKTGTTDLMSPEEMIIALDNITWSGAYLFNKKTEDGNVITYAVTDNQTKYPNGGWKDGYYWEQL
jgi:predicted membrane protein